MYRLLIDLDIKFQKGTENKSRQEIETQINFLIPCFELDNYYQL